MPKAILKIDMFHGGLSSNSDPRDIAPNELSVATDIMVDEVGKIRTMGGTAAHGETPANGAVINPGYGLFQFSHDRLGASTTGTAQNETGDDYLVMADTDGAADLDIYSKAADAWGTAIVSLGSTSGMKPTFFVVDGALRVSDGTFSNTNMWYGYIDRLHFNIGGSYVDTYDGWFSKEQAIASPTKGIIGGMSDVLAGTSIEDSNVGIWLTSTGTFTNVTNDQIAGHLVLNLAEASAVAVASRSNANTIVTASVTGWDTEDAFMIFPPAGTGFNIFTEFGTGDSDWENATYNLASTFIYDGNQESLPFTLASSFTITDTDKLPTFHVWATSPYNERLTGARIYYREADTNDYWTLLIDINMRDGSRIGLFDDYDAWTAIDTPTIGWEDWGGDWNDFGESTSDYWENMAAPALSSGLVGPYIQTKHEITTPDTINIFEIMSGISQEENSISAKFKTSVVANRMVYVGNIQTKSVDDITVSMGDAMIKSPVNKFDVFPLKRIIEASIRDGDNIVKLEEYADRILQFKKNKMHLINISQEIEFLEDTFMYKGVSHPAATCKTDFGIAWVNKLGCYLYDGKQVVNLLEKQGRQIIKESDWATFTANEPMIGYIPKKRQLLIVDDNSATGTGNIFLYDMVTQSWVEGADATITSTNLTNFVTDWNGDLIHAHTDDTGTVLKWVDDLADATTSTSSAVDIKTKDIDFGNPAQRKKIYKIYVTHRGSASNIQTSYAVDGDQDTFTEAGSEFPVTSAVTDWVTTEITLSISNCYSLRLRFFSDGATPANFEINDISIVYRLKPVK